MERTKVSVNAGRMGCLTVVGIVLVVLKLVGVHPVSEWSWILVLAPFWAPVLGGVLLGCTALVLCIVLSRRRR